MTDTTTAPADQTALTTDLSQPLAQWETDLLVAQAERAHLIDTALRAAFPPHNPAAVAGMRELPHDELVALVEAGTATATFEELLGARLAMGERIVAALVAALTEPEPDPEEAGPAAQRVHTDTLRRWAVWSDQIVELASQRRALAANGARHLADDIRREIAHPADQPGLAANLYRDESLFDHDRADPNAEPAVQPAGVTA